MPEAAGRLAGGRGEARKPGHIKERAAQRGRLFPGWGLQSRGPLAGSGAVARHQSGTQSEHPALSRVLAEVYCALRTARQFLAKLHQLLRLCRHHAEDGECLPGTGAGAPGGSSLTLAALAGGLAWPQACRGRWGGIPDCPSRPKEGEDSGVLI